MHSGNAIAPLEHVPLQPLSTLGVGGPARWFVTAEHVEDVAAAHAWSVERGIPMFVLGGGSNLVVADRGFDGLVLRVALRGVDVTDRSGEVTIAAAAGENWDALVQRVVERGLPGIECLSGIPGTVGGTPIQNVGAYGQDVSESIERVMVYDTIEKRAHALTNAECGFSYRMSRFKGADAGRFVVCGVTFRFRQGWPTTSYADVSAHLNRIGVTAPTVADVRAAVLDIRRRKGMVLDPTDPDTRSVGSFFMNPVVSEQTRESIRALTGTDVPGFAVDGSRVKIPAAWLIERAGFGKGYADGPVAISSKHPLAIVNCGGATARAIVRFASTIKRGVGERFGVWLRPEPIFVGFGADPELTFLQQADH